MEQVDQSTACQDRGDEATGSEAEQLTSSSVPNAACSTSGSTIFITRKKLRTGKIQDAGIACTKSPVNKVHRHLIIC